MSVRADRSPLDRPATNSAGYDTHGVRPNSRLRRQFNEVISGVTEVSNGALQDIRELKESYEKVERQFAEINKVYDEFQTRFDEIRATMQNIVGIANQTNLLALNGSA